MSSNAPDDWAALEDSQLEETIAEKTLSEKPVAEEDEDAEEEAPINFFSVCTCSSFSICTKKIDFIDLQSLQDLVARVVNTEVRGKKERRRRTTMPGNT